MFKQIIMRIQLSIFFACLFLIGCSQKPIAFKKFIPYYFLGDTIGIKEIEKVSMLNNYIIHNYEDSKSTEKMIDSFVNCCKDINWARYQQYEMFFYKESKYMNEALIAENPRSIDTEEAMNCLVYRYHWTSGKDFEKVKEKDGIEIEVYPKRKGVITIEEVKSSNRNK